MSEKKYRKKFFWLPLCLKSAGEAASVVGSPPDHPITVPTGNKLLCLNDRWYDIYYDFVHNRGRTLLFK